MLLPFDAPLVSGYPFSSAHPRYLFSPLVFSGISLKKIYEGSSVESLREYELVKLCSISFVAMERIERTFTTTFTSTSNNSVVGQLSM